MVVMRVEILMVMILNSCCQINVISVIFIGLYLFKEDSSLGIEPERDNEMTQEHIARQSSRMKIDILGKL